MQNKALLSKYYKEIKHALPCSRRERDEIMQIIESNVSDYVQDHPDATMASIEQHFGTPVSIAASYIDSVDCEKIINRMHMRKTIKRTVIVAATVIVLLWCAVIGWAIVKETQHLNGWQTTDIVVEMS